VFGGWDTRFRLQIRSACTAVGDYLKNSAGDDATLAEAWNGKKWLIEPTPSPTTTSYLSAVSCNSTTACTAVGEWLGDAYFMLVEAWNGKKWTVEPTPLLSGGSYVYGVSCSSVTACTAVGSQFNIGSLNQDWATLAEAWNGKRWTVEPSPNPVPVEYETVNAFEGVSCISATACMAVGSSNVNDFSPLTEIWNGTSWGIVPSASTLWGGDGLRAGASLQSTGGQYRLVMQARDGNLVLYSSTNRALWASRTAGNPGARAVMQGDGNFVIYSAGGRALWATGTENNPGSSAVLQRDGNFVIYSASGRALWASGT
jgi:hypothetical protein